MGEKDAQTGKATKGADRAKQVQGAAETKDLTEDQKSLVVGNSVEQMFEDDAGAGFEGTSMDDYALPFLVILQKGSPQVDKDHAKYVPGAETGLFFNTATQKILGPTVRVVPVFYERKFAEWVPREQGGGFRGHHQPEAPEVQDTVRDERGRFVTKNGTHMMDTRYYFLLILNEDNSVDQAVLALSSTGIKKSKLWMTAMRAIRMRKPDGSVYNPPMFSHIYKLTTEAEKKDEYTWRGLVHEIERPLGKDEVLLYQLAKDFRQQISAGKAKIDEAQMDRDGSGGFDEEEAF